MEIVKSRFGVDRSIERINLNLVRVLGESQFIRKSTNKHGEITMFDFEGGPCLSIGGELVFQNMKWRITAISPVASKYEGLSECVLTVKPGF